MPKTVSRTVPLALLLVLTTGAAWGAPTLVWDPNPADESVVGYTCYWSATSRHDPAGTGGYDHQVSVSTTRCEIDPQHEMPALYFAAVVARNAAGLASDYSTEVTVDLGGSGSGAAGSGGGSGGGGGGGCFLQLLSSGR